MVQRTTSNNAIGPRAAARRRAAAAAAERRVHRDLSSGQMLLAFPDGDPVEAPPAYRSQPGDLQGMQRRCRSVAPSKAGRPLR